MRPSQDEYIEELGPDQEKSAGKVATREPDAAMVTVHGTICVRLSGGSARYRPHWFAARRHTRKDARRWAAGLHSEGLATSWDSSPGML